MGDAIGLFKSVGNTDIPADIQALAQQRWDAKQNKDYALADQIRDRVTNAGYIIDDSSNGFVIRQQ